jgi:hypothetical protein
MLDNNASLRDRRVLSLMCDVASRRPGCEHVAKVLSTAAGSPLSQLNWLQRKNIERQLLKEWGSALARGQSAGSSRVQLPRVQDCTEFLRRKGPQVTDKITDSTAPKTG